MQLNKERNPLAEYIALILSLLLVLGVKTFIRPCGLHDDGSYGMCRSAGQTVFYLGLVLCLLALSAALSNRRTGRIVSSAAGCILAVVTALIPGTIMSLCMMPGMRCRTIMKPGVLVISILTAAAFAVSAWMAVNSKKA